MESSTRTGIARVAALTLLLVAAARGPASAAGSSVVATVGPLTIMQQELDQRAAEMERQYRDRAGRELGVEQRQLIRRQALEILVRQRLYRLDSGRAKVSDAEVEAYVKRMGPFNPGGRFSQSAWDHARQNDPKGFQRALAEARRDLGAARLADELRRRYTPPEDAVRRAVERDLVGADLDALVLPRGVFGARYPEPAERDVAREYREHLHEFDQPAEAVLRAIVLESTPPPSRSRADSVVAALRAGRSVSEAADAFGATTRNITIREDNLPGSWRASEALTARIFHSVPGSIVPEPIPTPGGFYVAQVDRTTPRRTAPLAEASGVIRDRLRSDLRRATDDVELRRLYASARDSLSRPGYRLRVAIVDAASVKLPDPTEAELAAFYQSRLADYSRFDPQKQALVVRPLAEVRGELVDRWRTSRRDLVARDVANRIEEAWSQGRRDKSLEAQATVHEPGAVAFGSMLDLGPRGIAISDSLRRRVYGRLLEVMPVGGGYAVVNAYEMVERVVPPLDQVRTGLLERLELQHEAADVEAARLLYERDPQRWLKGRLVYYSRLWNPQPELINVPLTRQEVEAYYREHLAEYASPEKFRVHHILIAAGAAGSDADRRAHDRATELVARLRKGEDFAELARRVSEDDHTRDDGGDLGYRTAGELAPELQEVAFKMKLGAVSDPVRSTDGWHVLRVTEHLPEQAEPLAWVYTAVGADAALKKSQVLARARADSIAQVVRTPAQGRAIAAKLGLRVEQFRHAPGFRGYPEELLPMAERLERMQPGEIYPGSEFFLGQGAAMMWVDSIAPPRMGSWDEVRDPVLVEYRQAIVESAVRAKEAELDSLLRAGWSFDSVGALWGGLTHQDRYRRRGELPGVGLAPEIDSLAFGTASAPPLPVRVLSGWLDLPRAGVRVRVNALKPATPDEVEHQVGQYRGIELEYGMLDELREMKQRHPVRILDATLRHVSLPPLPRRPEM